MKFTFGKSGDEIKNESRGGDGSGDWMRYPSSKEATQIRILDEPDKWKWFWEHFNPNGYPFPCTGDRDTCPGCTSDDEKMSRASKRAAFNAFDGQYTNVWKVAKTIAEKLEMRSDRIGTITDRDYLITPYKGDNGFINYDVEGLDKGALDEDHEQYKRDPEELLVIAYEQSWGPVDEDPVQQPKPDNKAEKKPEKKAEVKTQDKPRRTMKSVAKKVAEKPKFEYDPEHDYTDEELRKMEPWDVLVVAEKEGFPEVPKSLLTSNEIVDWMVEQLSEE